MQTISHNASTKKSEINIESTTRWMSANAEHSFSDVVQMTVCAQIAGATTMEHVSKICSDEIISRCAGWEKVSHATSVGLIIKSVRELNITEPEALVPRLRDKLWKRMVRNAQKSSLRHDRHDVRYGLNRTRSLWPSGRIVRGC